MKNKDRTGFSRGIFSWLSIFKIHVFFTILVYIFVFYFIFAGKVHAQRDSLFAADNWISKYNFEGLNRFQISNLSLSRDSSVIVFSGLGVYKITNHLIGPKKISNLVLTKPVKDNRGFYYYFKDTTVFAIHENDLNSNNPLRFTLNFLQLPLDLKESIHDIPRIMCISVDADGNNIYLGTEKHGLCFLTKPRIGDKKWYPLLNFAYKPIKKNNTDQAASKTFPSNQIKVLHSDKSGRLWIGFDKGLVLKENKKFYTIIKDFNTKTIYERPEKDEVWVTAEKKYKENSLYVFKTSEKVSWGLSGQKPAKLWFIDPNEIWTTYFDSDGDFWFASSSLIRVRNLKDVLSFDDLINKIDKAAPAVYSAFEGLDSRSPICILQDKMGVIWIGTSDKGLYYLIKGLGIRKEKKIVNCHNGKDGTLTIMPTDGVEPFKLIWNSNRGKYGEVKNIKLFQRINIGNNIEPDTFSFILIDKLGVSEKYIVSFDNPAKVDFEIADLSTPSSATDKDGRIKILPSGGRVDCKNYLRPKCNYQFEFPGYKQENASVIPYIGWEPIKIKVTDTLGCFAEKKFQFLDCQSQIGKKITLPISYDESETELYHRYTQTIDNNVLLYMQNCDNIKLIIKGSAYIGCTSCEKFGEGRAEGIKKYLVKMGVSGNRITSEYSGKKVEPNMEMIEIEFKN